MFLHNKVVNVGSCDYIHRRFLDFHCIIDNILLCIDVDENQHKSYDDEAEISRKNDIMAVYTTPHIFIRFSPNGRYVSNNKTYNPILSNRLQVLKQNIDKTLDLIKTNKIYKSENLLTEIYLFYDD